MEKQERFVIEVLLGVILVVFLIMLIFLFTGVSGKTQTSTVISNSYNTNTYTLPTPSYSFYNPPYSSYRPISTRSSYRPLATRPSYRDPYSKPYIVSDRYSDTARLYYVKDDIRYTKSDDRYLRYQDFGQHRTVKGIFGNNIDKYEVYVRNRDYIGGYFTVRFNFEDYYGRTSSYSITHYIKPQEEKRFLFKDVSTYDYKYGGWRYEVIPRTKAPTSVYYNSYSPRTIEKLMVTSVVEEQQAQIFKEFTIEGSEVAEVTQAQALKEFTIEGSEYKFNPKSISVNKDDRVRIIFKNTGGISHNFGIPLLGVRSRTISSGASDTIEFVAEKTGTFDFDCSIPGHRGLGMEGQLIINGEQSTNQQTSFPSTSSYGSGY